MIKVRQVVPTPLPPPFHPVTITLTERHEVIALRFLLSVAEKSSGERLIRAELDSANGCISTADVVKFANELYRGIQESNGVKAECPKSE